LTSARRRTNIRSMQTAARQVLEWKDVPEIPRCYLGDGYRRPSGLDADEMNVASAKLPRVSRVSHLPSTLVLAAALLQVTPAWATRTEVGAHIKAYGYVVTAGASVGRYWYPPYKLPDNNSPLRVRASVLDFAAFVTPRLAVGMTLFEIGSTPRFEWHHYIAFAAPQLVVRVGPETYAPQFVRLQVSPWYWLGSPGCAKLEYALVPFMPVPLEIVALGSLSAFPIVEDGETVDQDLAGELSLGLRLGAGTWFVQRHNEDDQSRR